MIELTTDTDFIVSCITHPYIWDRITDDGAPDRDLYFPPINEGIMWVKVDDYGVFMLAKQNHVTYEVHTILLPCARGKAVEIGKQALEWAFLNTDAKRIITNVPSCNPLALRLARSVGFKDIGINELSFQKNGVLYDQFVLGISKEDKSCQQQS